MRYFVVGSFLGALLYFMGTAAAGESHKMTRERVHEEGHIIDRFENSEAVCYIAKEGISCVKR